MFYYLCRGVDHVGSNPPPHGVGYQEGILCTLLNSIHMDIPVADVACLKRMCWKLLLFRPKPQPLIEFCMAKIRLFKFSGNCCECIWLKQSELRHHRKSDELFFVFLSNIKLTNLLLNEFNILPEVSFLMKF